VVHLLHEEIMSLLKQWLVRFLKPSAIPTQLSSFLTIDVEDFSLWLPPYEISIGENARRLMVSFSSSDQQTCLATIRGVFISGTQKLLKTLPIGSSLLRSCQLLSPKNRDHPQVETWGTDLYKHLSSFIPQVDKTTLEVELRLYSSSVSDQVASDSVSEYWSSLEEKHEFPSLCSLMKAVILIPHGNADIERQFSVLADIVTKKRGRLLPGTIKSLIVTKSIFATNGWRSSNVPIDEELLKLSSTASRNYRKRLNNEAKDEEKRKRRKMEKDFVEKFDNLRKADEVLMSTDSASKNVEDDIAKLMEEREKLSEMLAFANKKSEESEARLKALLDQKKKLDSKKEKKMKNLLTDFLLKNKPSTSK
jgi:hypothetical protein